MDLTAMRIVFSLLGTVVVNVMAGVGSDMQSTNVSITHNVSHSSNAPPLQREGHDKDIEKVMLPMLLGLKLSGLATATFTILKIFVLQALMASKVALLGALLLAFKSLYVYLRDKYWKTKHTHLDTYPYPGFMFPQHWPQPQWEWPEGYFYPPTNLEDYHSQASGANSVLQPYPYASPHNHSFAVKADRDKLRISPPGNMNTPYIARITETTYD